MYRAKLLLTELLLIAFATSCSLALINNFEVSEAILLGFAPYLVLTIATAVVILAFFQTYRSVWRFTGMADYLRLRSATGAIVAGAGALCLWFNITDGLALPILQGLLILFFLVGVRVLGRVRHTVQERLARGKPRRKHRVTKAYSSLVSADWPIPV